MPGQDKRPARIAAAVPAPPARPAAARTIALLPSLGYPWEWSGGAPQQAWHGPTRRLPRIAGPRPPVAAAPPSRAAARAFAPVGERPAAAAAGRPDAAAFPGTVLLSVPQMPAGAAAGPTMGLAGASPGVPDGADNPPGDRPVRQTGRSASQGLLQGVTPGAVFASRLYGSAAFGVEAGVMKIGNAYRDYDFASTTIAMAGLTAHAEFAIDAAARTAELTTLRQDLAGGFAVVLTRLQNWNFESALTGQGRNLARDFTELGVEMALGPGKLGFGFRDTARLKGGRAEAVRAWQWLPLGDGLSLTDTAVIPVLGSGGLGATVGSLELAGSWRKLDYWAEFDYGDGARLRPTGYMVGLDGPLAPSWHLASALSYSGWDHSLSVGIGVTKRFGRLTIGPTLDIDSRGHGQLMLRLWRPLGRLGLPHRWLYRAQTAAADFRNAARPDNWCLRQMICR